MRLLAAAAASLFVYLLVGVLTGHEPRLARRHRRSLGSLGARLRQSNVEVTPGQFLAVSVLLGLVTFLVVWALTDATPVAVVPALVVGALPRAWFERQRRRLGRERERAWPDALRHLVASLEVPMSLHRALVELGRSGPEPLRDVLARYEAAAALDQTSALRAIRSHLADPVSDRIIEVLLVAQAKGNRVVVEILRDMADQTAADLRLGEEIETANLEKRIEARSAVALPFAVLILLCAGSEPYREFYSTSRGAVVIALGAAMSFAGMTVISRLGRQPGQPRVLTTGDEAGP